MIRGQRARIAQRATVGIARKGGAGKNSNGDLLRCFSTPEVGERMRILSNEALDPVFHDGRLGGLDGGVDALLSAETMTSRGGLTVHAVDPARLEELLRR
ncbi:MAG TPA: P1 family peptidase [Gaiellaceae bacterium]|nr:P1 family peptidase [Gaiellaceae bacterium]